MTMQKEKGRIHLYYGGGKGKTTAAVGSAVRALGQGLDVLFVQFLKDDGSGELEPLRKLGAEVLCGPAKQKFTFLMDETEKLECARQQNARLRQAMTWAEGKPGAMIILDEVVDAAQLGFLPLKELCRWLDDCREAEIILTGHSAPQWAAERADYVTCMGCEKHPYQQGQPARRGVEY